MNEEGDYFLNWQSDERLMFLTDNDLRNYLYLLMTYKTLSDKLSRYYLEKYSKLKNKLDKKNFSRFIEKSARKNFGFYLEQGDLFEKVFMKFQEKGDIKKQLYKSLNSLSLQLRSNNKDKILINYFHNIREFPFDYKDIKTSDQLLILLNLVNELLKECTIEEFFKEYPQYRYPDLDVKSSKKEVENHKVSVIFNKKPEYWGLRGDPYFFEYLAEIYDKYELPIHPLKFEKIFYDEFLKVSGEKLTEEINVYVEEFDHGGMSRGHLNGDYWVNIGIPYLISGLVQYNANFNHVSLNINEDFIKCHEAEIAEALASEGIIPFEFPGLRGIDLKGLNFNEKGKIKFIKYIANLPLVKQMLADLPVKKSTNITLLNKGIVLGFSDFKGDYPYKQFNGVKFKQSFDVGMGFAQYIFSKELEYFINLHPEFRDIIDLE